MIAPVLRTRTSIPLPFFNTKSAGAMTLRIVGYRSNVTMRRNRNVMHKEWPLEIGGIVAKLRLTPPGVRDLSRCYFPHVCHLNCTISPLSAEREPRVFASSRSDINTGILFFCCALKMSSATCRQARVDWPPKPREISL